MVGKLDELQAQRGFFDPALLVTREDVRYRELVNDDSK